MKTAITGIVGLSVLALTPLPATAHDLPGDIPKRKPGLWEMVTTGSVGPNQIKAIKRYCLDVEADRALYELHMLRMELEVVHSDISCQSPNLAMIGNVMTGELACRTNSQDDSEAAGKDFRWEVTFASDSDVVLEEHSVPREVMFLLENNTIERQRRIGDCPADLKPGDSLDLGFTYNSEAWPNEANPGNIYESLEVVRKLLKEGSEINKRLGPM